MPPANRSPLFQPGRLGRLELKNRIVRSATAERLADENGVPSPALSEMYYELARGEVGLIVSGHAYVARGGRCHHEMTAADRDELIPQLTRLPEAVHKAGGLAAMQINHGGANCDPTATPERVAPSPRPDQEDGGCRAMAPRAMASDEIPLVIDAYAQAARRVKEAGFDAVQIHGAHGYLVSQFLSPLTNRRQDEWGGSLQNRVRFLCEIARAIRAQVGPEYTLLIKLGVCDSEAGGLTLAEGLQVVASLEAMGFDGVEISHGIGSVVRSTPTLGASPAEQEAAFLSWARQAREATKLPLILVNGLRSRAAMEEVIASGAADFIALCRPLICEPDLPLRLRTGGQDVAACISCNRCWPETMGEGVACRSL